MTGNRQAKPTKADRAAAKKLLAYWDERKKARGLTQDKMADILGITQGAVSQYLHGKIPMGYLTLVGFTNALGLHPADIRTDLPEQRVSISVVREADPPPYKDMERGQVPYIAAQQVTEWLAGGRPAVHGWMFCPVDVGRRAFVTIQRGIAMAPRFNDGDFLFIDPDETPVHGSGVLVMLAGEAPSVRELQVDGDAMLLGAANPDWPGARLTMLPTDAVIAGVVVGKWVPA